VSILVLFWGADTVRKWAVVPTFWVNVLLPSSRLKLDFARIIDAMVTFL
jgi:hypothetical protein